MGKTKAQAAKEELRKIETPTIPDGQRVRVLIDSPTGQPIEGVVRITQAEAGKEVGVEFDHYIQNGHSLDGLLEDEEKVDPQTGIRYGKGWWTLEDNIERI